MTKLSGYPKGARGAEDGFSKHGRGSEVKLKDADVSAVFKKNPLPVSGGRSIAIGEGCKADGAHGYGHKGNGVRGVLRMSGNKKAHLVGNRRGK
jgi:hypothetical protein